MASCPPSASPVLPAASGLPPGLNASAPGSAVGSKRRSLAAGGGERSAPAPLMAGAGGGFKTLSVSGCCRPRS